MDLSQVRYAYQSALAHPDVMPEDSESVHRLNDQVIDTFWRCEDNWKPQMECSTGKILLGMWG